MPRPVDGGGSCLKRPGLASSRPTSRAADARARAAQVPWTAAERREVLGSKLVLLHFGSHAHNVSRAEAAWASFAARLELEGQSVRRKEGGHPRSSHSMAVWGFLPSHFPGEPDGEFNPEHRGRYQQPSARCEALALGAATSEPARNFRRAAALRFAARHGLAVLDGWADAVGNHDDHLGGALTRSRIAGRTGAFDCKCAARCRTRLNPRPDRLER